MTRVAIQGQLGSFHHIVAERFFGSDVDVVCCDSFRDVFESLAQRQADYGVAGIENSLYGSIVETYDLLLKYRFPVVGEEIEHVHQQLIAAPGTKLQDITEVYSQVMALNQCRGWLEKHIPKAELVEYFDTADAVRHIIELDSPYAAAIASRRAAEIYGGTIIAPDIEDEKANLTRFVILQPDGNVAADANKASLVLTASHQPGALYRALGVFAAHDANLTKLESRPIRGERFRYQFFIDAECDAQTLAAIINELHDQHCETITLGHYLSASTN